MKKRVLILDKEIVSSLRINGGDEELDTGWLVSKMVELSMWVTNLTNTCGCGPGTNFSCACPTATCQMC